MEIDHQPTMANFSNSTRLQNSICTATDTMEECKEDNNSRRANAHQFSSEEVLGWGHDRDLTNAEPQLSIEIFHPSREDQTPSNLGLPEIKQLHSGRTLQNGGSSRTARIDRERRLYLQNRSERRLRRSSYSPGVTRLLKLRKRRRRLSLQVARLWTKYSTKNLLQDHEICNRTVKKSRNTNYLLPRRPLFVSKNQTRNALSNAKSEVSFRGLRVHHKLCKKYVNPLKETGILRLRIQQQDDGHLRTTTENSELIETCPSIAKSPKEILPMDSGITGENNFNATSYWGSSTTHSLLTTGSGEISPSITSELGNNLQLILYQPRRTSLVGNVCNAKEWPSNPDNHNICSTNSDPRRCFGQRMGDQLAPSNSLRILETGREITVNKRSRVEDNPFCAPTTRIKMRKLHHQDLLGQSDRLEIYDKVGWNDFSFSPRTSSSNPRIMQLPQHQSYLSTHSRSSQYSSGQTESSQTTILRISHSKTDVQHDPTAMGQTKDRCLCSKAQLSTTNLLDANLRPSSSSSGCNETTLAQEGDVCLPTLEDDTTSSQINKTATINKSCTSDTIVAEPVLVPDDTEHETFESTYNMEGEQEMESSRLAVINHKRLQDGLDQHTIDYLNSKIRQSTQKAYDHGWNNWVKWCETQQPRCDPVEYNPLNVLQFLRHNQNFSSNHLNTLRSSIASVFSILYPDKQQIAEQMVIKEFFAAKRKSEVKIPTEQQLVTWDINILVEYVKTQLSPSETLSLEQLQLKTILLLCMATMWRPRSDIGRLQHRDIILKEDENGMTMRVHARTPKESQIKSIILGQNKEEELCPVRTTSKFLSLTTELRKDLPDDHTLFLTYIDSPKVSTSVRPTTVANWIKTAMEAAGVDTNAFQAHSIRAASSTKAVELGHQIQDVKKHANWSLNSNTFEKYYYKPSSQASSSTAISNSIFSTEKRITLEVGVESTGISLGTTTNTNVDETKTENVIHTPPWYKRFFR
ncbi:hypothetical protein G6F17_011455 [Rhizopus arrhizus]|nr:hypothetical protein G6F17_011455 [Rhizopus arrhizus]